MPPHGRSWADMRARLEQSRQFDTLLRTACPGIVMALRVARVPCMVAARGLLCGTWEAGGGTCGRKSKVLTETNWTGATRTDSVSLSTGEYHSPQESITLHRRVNSGGRPSLSHVPEHYKTVVLHSGKRYPPQAAAANQECRVLTTALGLLGHQALRLKPNYQTSKGRANPYLLEGLTTAGVKESRRLRPILHDGTHLPDWWRQNQMLCCRWSLGNISHHTNQARPGSISDRILPEVQA